MPSSSSDMSPSFGSGSKAFMDAVRTRRTIYAINDESPISDDKIEELVKQTVLHCPSSFNSQSTRCVLLLKKEHEQFWDMVKTVLKALVPEDKFEQTEKKIDGFGAGYGTILFLEDPEPIKKLQSQYPLYSEHFPQWSEHTTAMHQFTLWTALEMEGFAANLQHYNPVIDQKVQAHWKIPLEWSLKAQLVFGGKAGPPAMVDKQFFPLEQKVFVHGK